MADGAARTSPSAGPCRLSPAARGRAGRPATPLQPDTAPSARTAQWRPSLEVPMRHLHALDPAAFYLVEATLRSPVFSL